MRNTAQDECIKLSFPVNAAYVSSARLTASSVANRMNFDIDEIEDIKTAVSEACTYIINTLTTDDRGNFEISFRLRDDVIMISIATQGRLAPPQAGDMSLMMIKAVVDDFEIDNDDADNVSIQMKKKHKASIFA